MSSARAERFEHVAPLLKASPDGYVLAPVLVPQKIDEQGDWVSEETIERAMASFARNGRKIDLMHNELLDEREVMVVESYTLRAATTIEGVFLPRGTWILGLQISPRLRAAVKAGQLSGLSIRGNGVRKPDPR